MHCKSRSPYPLRKPAPAIGVFLLVLLASAACGVDSVSPSAGNGTQIASSGGSSAIHCLAPSRPSSQGGCFTQDAATGISLRVSNAYADAVSTVVTLQMANTDNYPLALALPQLALRSGGIVPGGGGYYSGPSAFLVVEPVPEGDFGHLVDFVATTGVTVAQSYALYPPTLPPAPPWLGKIGTLTLSVPFAITPVRAGGYSYHQAPSVQHGIGVQVQSLEYSYARSVFYGTAGGASVELRFSGLPADLEMLSFIRLESHQNFGASQGGDNGPGQIDLQIPGMSVSTPAFTILQNPTWPQNPNETSEEPVVGAAGTVQLEVSFQGSGKPNGKPATLSISGIQFLTGGIDGTSGTTPVLPFYQITLPI